MEGPGDSHSDRFLSDLEKEAIFEMGLAVTASENPESLILHSSSPLLLFTPLLPPSPPPSPSFHPWICGTVG